LEEKKKNNFNNELTNCKIQNVDTKVPPPTHLKTVWKKLPRTLTLCCPLVSRNIKPEFSTSNTIKNLSGSLQCRGSTQVSFLPGQEKIAGVLSLLSLGIMLSSATSSK